MLAVACDATAAPPPLPSINTNNIFNVTNAPYNAKPDGVTTNTTAIQNAINAATAASAGVGGGTVELPGPGTYLCGPLTLKSKVNLQVDAGATLMMLPKASWPGGTFILGSSIHDVEISGSGTIDGQGAGWWPAGGSRPNFIEFTGSTTLLMQSLRMQNPPTFHLMLKGNNANITIQGIDIDTPYPSPNTDGMDLGSTNMLIQNCHITDGDDNIEIGGSSALAAWITITNCMFGHGHGVSVGSLTQAGVHDVTVINCIFTNTENAIKIKSDNDRGGPVQNMFYYNLSMTNLVYAPIAIYSYYNAYGGVVTTKGITPSVAASTTVASITGTEPAYRNITISNITATAAQPGMIFARTEFPATNIILAKLNITATDANAGNGSFAIYNARGVQVSDSTITVAGSRKTFELFNAQVVFSNSAPGGAAISLDGLSVTNPLAFYKQSATFSDNNLFGATPISLGGSILSDATSLTLPSPTPVNFTVGTNAAQIAVTGNLTLNSVLNITNGPGFAPGTNILFTYTGTFGGQPTLGSTPGGSYTYSLVTNVASKQVNLVVVSTGASTPTTNSIQSSANPSTYGNTVMFTATVTPAPTNGESVTFKDGSTTLGTGPLNSGQATYTTTATQLAAVSHSITAVYAGDGAYGASTSSALTQTNNARGLTVSGLTVNSKVYDRMTAATLNTNSYVLNTVIGGDAVTLVTNGYSATFANSNVANNISVTVGSLSLGGAQAGNYTLTQPMGLTGNITALGLTVSGLTVNSKIFDGTTAATLNTNGYVLNTVIGGDAVTLVSNGYSATFANSNVANNISVTVTNLSLGGAQAGNYTLTQPTGLTGNITLAGSSISLGSSANPVAHLSAVSFTANMTPSTLSGTVLFLTNGVAFNSQTLSGGTATSINTAGLPRGTNLITAQYSGNSNYSPSTNTLSVVVTNNPPTANPAVYYRLVGSPLTIAIANLATNWIDLDSDPVNLAGVSSPSTNGAAVTFDSTNIYYNDANNVTDIVSYTIRDGQGGTNNGTVTVLMAQQLVSGITANSDGSMTLGFTGIPGSTNWVLVVTNLTPPVNWVSISTNTANTNGLWQFTDPQATNYLRRFYRTQSSY